MYGISIAFSFDKTHSIASSDGKLKISPNSVIISAFDSLAYVIASSKAFSGFVFFPVLK